MGVASVPDEREVEVFVEAIPNIKAEAVLELTVKKVRRGSLVYTDRYRIYEFWSKPWVIT